MTYLWLSLVWAIWCALHSALICPACREWLARRWPAAGRYHRLAYNLFAGLSLIPVVWLMIRADGPWVLVWPWPWLRWLLVAGLLCLGWRAMRVYGLVRFLGLNPLLGQPEPTRPSAPLTSGVLGWLRHPLYAVALGLLWARDLRAADLATSLVLSVYILIGTWLEEGRLLQEWGPAWVAYRTKVSALFPFKRLKRLIDRVDTRNLSR